MEPHQSDSAQTTPLKVAIVGGGIAGAALAVGLSAAHSRGSVRVRLYEQTPSPQELGFAVAFARSARRALSLLDPRVAARLGLPDEDAGDDDDSPGGSGPSSAGALGSMVFVDGNDSAGEPQALGPNTAPLGQWASRRTAVLEGLLSLVAAEVVVPGKKLVRLRQDADGRKPVMLHFADGTAADADVVIGCDGLHSRVRTHVLAPEHSESSDTAPSADAHAPRFAHTVVHRALVHLTDDADLAALGGSPSSGAAVAAEPAAEPAAATTAGGGLPPGLLYYIGPGALAIHAAVAPRLVSFSVYMRHSGPWADARHTKDATTKKTDLIDYFSGWHPRVRAMAAMLPGPSGTKSDDDDDDRQKSGGGISTWALYDLAERPLPTYARGAVAVAGDAAHATMPFYGHGAGMCVLDALCLARLLESAAATSAVTGPEERSKGGSSERSAAAAPVTQALRVYDSLLRPHTQFVVESSRAFAERGPLGAREAHLPFNAASGAKMSAEFRDRMAVMAGFNVDDLLEQAEERFRRAVEFDG